MKLGKLNAAIDAAPKVKAVTRWGYVNFEKASLKAALAAHFGGDRGRETGVRVDKAGVLCGDQGEG